VKIYVAAVEPLKKKEDSTKLSLPTKLMVLRISPLPLNANVLLILDQKYQSLFAKAFVTKFAKSS
jgi:hypothetical protein